MKKKEVSGMMVVSMANEVKNTEFANWYVTIAARWYYIENAPQAKKPF